MIFRDIYLQPDLVEYKKKDTMTSEFRYQSRSVCVYLERFIKPLKFKADFKRIVFVGKSNPNNEIFLNSCNVLSVDIPFDEQEYKNLDEGDLNHYFIGLLKTGINKCAKQTDIPYDELLNGLIQFEKGKYINQWQFKRRSFRELGVKCCLECELTIHNFHLTLSIEKKAKIVWEKEILTTEPDEICYYYHFKDIILKDNKIIVIDRSDNAMFELSADELGL